MRMRNRKILIFAATVFGLFFSASAAFALNTDHPALQVSIPGVKFTDIKTDAGSKIDIPWIGQYISAVYKYATGIGVVIAALMMIIGGFQYTVAGGDSAKVSAAKERVTNGTVGLTILLGAFVLLSSVDPSLTVFKPVPIQVSKQDKFSSLKFAAPVEDKKEGDTCKETSECQAGLTCEGVKSIKEQAKELVAAAAAQAKTLATGALEKMRQTAFDAADSADTVTEGLYNAAMQAIAEGEKYLAKVISAADAKIAADKLREPVIAARKAATDVRAKVHAAAEEAFKKAAASLETKPSSGQPTEEPKENQKKECKKNE